MVQSSHVLKQLRRRDAAMPTTVSCPCGHELRAPEHLVGKKVKCPACGAPIQIPGVTASPAAGSLQARLSRSVGNKCRQCARPIPQGEKTCSVCETKSVKQIADA